jgi:3-phenylpropionate/cinnamic acid dioxygenase small subunit
MSNVAPTGYEAGLAQLLLQREVEAFYTREAELLDDRRFTEWLDLFAEDARYFMPIARNVAFDRPQDEYTRERSDANWFDEGKDDLAKRVQQIEGGDHWAEEPRSRTSHLITNVNVAEIRGAEMTVRCRFIVSQIRQNDDVNLFVGKRTDILRRTDALRIAHRTIYLDQSVLLAKGLTTFF